eukprot:CFRG3825T1
MACLDLNSTFNELGHTFGDLNTTLMSNGINQYNPTMTSSNGQLVLQPQLRPQHMHQQNSTPNLTLQVHRPPLQLQHRRQMPLSSFPKPTQVLQPQPQSTVIPSLAPMTITDTVTKMQGINTISPISLVSVDTIKPATDDGTIVASKADISGAPANTITSTRSRSTESAKSTEELDKSKVTKNAKGSKDLKENSEREASADTSASPSGSEDTTDKPSRKRRCFRELIRDVQCKHIGCGRMYATESSLQNHIRIKHGNIRPEKFNSVAEHQVTRRHSSAGEKKSSKKQSTPTSEGNSHAGKQTITDPNDTNISTFLDGSLGMESPHMLCSPETASMGVASRINPDSDPEWSSSLLFDVDNGTTLSFPDFIDTDFSESSNFIMNSDSVFDAGGLGNNMFPSQLLDDWLKIEDYI